jgi:hypothetical protein
MLQNVQNFENLVYKMISVHGKNKYVQLRTCAKINLNPERKANFSEISRGIAPNLRVVPNLGM